MLDLGASARFEFGDSLGPRAAKGVLACAPFARAHGPPCCRLEAGGCLPGGAGVLASWEDGLGESSVGIDD